MKYNVLIDEFCETYQLGEVKTKRLLATGNVNRTSVVETETGKYVIKAINPSRIKTDDDIKRLEITEHIAKLANECGITSISAKVINGKIVNVLHEQHYIVFDFFEGKIIPLKEITTKNCFEIGRLLADLHNVSFKELSDLDFNHYLKKHNYGGQLKSKIEWKDYLNKASKYGPKWLERFESNLDDLYEVFNDSSASYLSFIPQDIVIAHGDLFNHNVMWKDNIPHIIDWEQSCFIDATYDCLYTATRWATKKSTPEVEESIDKDKLYAFFEGYTERRGLNVENLEISLYMILYKRVTFLRRNFEKYFNSEDEISKQRVEGEINHTLYILKGTKNLINHLEELKQYISERQTEKKYEKSPSYEIIPKMEQLIKNYNADLDKLNVKIDKLNVKLNKEEDKVNKLTKELNHVTKRAIGFRIVRKVKHMLKKYSFFAK